MGSGVHCKALNLNYKMMGLKEICDKMGKGYFNSGKLKISLSFMVMMAAPLGI